jgi:hypothetical protein
MKKSLVRGTIALVIAGGLALSGCSDDGTGPSELETGTYVKADFSGGYSGRLEATDVEMDKELEERNESAGAGRITGYGLEGLFIEGWQITGLGTPAARMHGVSFLILEPRVGTYHGGDFCRNDESVYLLNCKVVAIFGAQDLSTDWMSVLSEGTLKITELTADRVSGSFELSGEGFTRPESWEWSWDGEDEDEGWEPVARVNAKNGKFSVDILDAVDLEGLEFNKLPARVAAGGLRLDR